MSWDKPVIRFSRFADAASLRARGSPTAAPQRQSANRTCSRVNSARTGTVPSPQHELTIQTRRNPTLGFRAVLMQHLFAHAARLLMQRSAGRHCGRSRGQISVERTQYFRRSRIRQALCGTNPPFYFLCFAFAANLSARGKLATVAQCISPNRSFTSAASSPYVWPFSSTAKIFLLKWTSLMARNTGSRIQVN